VRLGLTRRGCLQGLWESTRVHCWGRGSLRLDLRWNSADRFSGESSGQSS